jgi:hypothetical protein
MLLFALGRRRDPEYRHPPRSAMLAGISFGGDGHSGLRLLTSPAQQD